MKTSFSHTSLFKNAWLAAILILLVFSGCSVSTKTQQQAQMPARTIAELKVKIEERFNDPLFAHAHWGVLIKSLRTGEVWFEKNSIKMFNPASNEKIPSAAAALTTLGPDFTFQTDLCLNGNIKDSVLSGDLVVFGDGDPTLYSHFFKDPRDLFRQWALLLKSKGVKTITGNIIGDDNSYDDNPYGFGWSFDGLDSYSYTEIGPLQLGENYVDIKITPPANKDGAIKIEPNIPSSYYTIINNLTVIDSGVNDVNTSRNFGANKIVVSGQVVAGSKPVTDAVTITNPTLFYVTVLKEVLTEEGIKVTGSALDCDDIPAWKHTAQDFTILDAHKSAPLKEILKEMMKRSQNLYAETMPRILGFKDSGLGSFRAGRKVVQQVLNQFGIEPGTYIYADGSGLSRYDYVSPEELTKILTSMRKSPYWETWRDALPIAGIDGTLRSRMKGTKAEGNVHAKTGTISNVRGLSGYVTTADGEEIVFSFLVNGHLRTSADTERITDDVLKMIAEFNRGAFIDAAVKL